MKRILIILILCTGVANAQSTLENKSSKQDSTIVTEETANNVVSEATSVQLNENTLMETENEKICYGETSKVAFYEVLIANNNFDIQLKDSNTAVVKNAEEMISRLRKRTLLASAE